LLFAPLFFAVAKGAVPIDPFLPDALRPAVEEAVSAELDAKRGPENALEILKAKKNTVSGDEALSLSLDLRIAAVSLRSRFLQATQFSEDARYVQALSTFSRLDLGEPGLSRWLDLALDRNPEAKRKLGKKPWIMKAAILARGSGWDKKLADGVLASALGKAGVHLDVVPPKEAPVVVVFGVEDAPHQENRASVKVTIALQRIERGKVVWEQSLFRTEAAERFADALASALTWAARIGGRDLFFRWLGENAFPALMDSTPHTFKPKDR
jgi:hypothetical protein